VDLNKIQDKDIRDILLQQIFHLGQTPTQLFASKHPSKNPISLPKLSNYIFSREDPTKTTSSRVIEHLTLVRIFLETKYESAFEYKSTAYSLSQQGKGPYTHRLQKLRAILSSVKHLEIQDVLFFIRFQLKSLLYDFLKWNEVKNKCAITKLGRIVFNDFSPGNQFSVLAQPQKPTYIIVGGYLDNSFKILKEEANIEVIETIQFHKVRIFFPVSL